MILKGLYEFWKRIRPSGENRFDDTSVAPLLSLIKGKDDIVVAEIGVFKADSSIAMLKSCRIRTFYAIDPWAPYAGYLASEESVTTRALREREGDAVFEGAKRRLRRFDNVIIVRSFSTEAAHDVSDGTLDFCFIDGNHSYTSVRKDIVTWLPKIKKGGILAGHDYFHPDVRRAVHDALKDSSAKVNGSGRHGNGLPKCWYIFC